MTDHYTTMLAGQYAVVLVGERGAEYVIAMAATEREVTRLARLAVESHYRRKQHEERYATPY